MVFITTKSTTFSKFIWHSTIPPHKHVGNKNLQIIWLVTVNCAAWITTWFALPFCRLVRCFHLLKLSEEAKDCLSRFKTKFDSLAESPACRALEKDIEVTYKKNKSMKNNKSEFYFLAHGYLAGLLPEVICVPRELCVVLLEISRSEIWVCIVSFTKPSALKTCRNWSFYLSVIDRRVPLKQRSGILYSLRIHRFLWFIFSFEFHQTTSGSNDQCCFQCM